MFVPFVHVQYARSRNLCYSELWTCVRHKSVSPGKKISFTLKKKSVSPWKKISFTRKRHSFFFPSSYHQSFAMYSIWNWELTFAWCKHVWPKSAWAALKMQMLLLLHVSEFSVICAAKTADFSRQKSALVRMSGCSNTSSMRVCHCESVMPLFCSQVGVSSFSLLFPS